MSFLNILDIRLYKYHIPLFYIYFIYVSIRFYTTDVNDMAFAGRQYHFC